MRVLMLLGLLSMTACAHQMVPVATPCPKAPDVSQEPWMQPPKVTDYLDAWQKIGEKNSSTSWKKPSEQPPN